MKTAVLLFALLLVGCGGNNDDDTPNPPSVSASQVPGHECHIVAGQYLCT